MTVSLIVILLMIIAGNSHLMDENEKYIKICGNLINTAILNVYVSEFRGFRFTSDIGFIKRFEFIE